ncbi:GPALPP motifs-containing protein 1 isoform X5 [Alligator sinensis]|uniref:GPALPP motifs-containing protein 1 n=1 Tax=Alligator sinensis TaxID=38654 RepID=A0A3Q0FXD7_ALLSI|nr:GPALPP motifs-containing protein 1 isoform X5 [Alligator sinensis]
MARELIGPALPPGFQRCPEADPDEDFTQVAGPALPPGYKSSCSSETSNSDEDPEFLPLLREMDRDSEEPDTDPAPKPVIGPALPPGFRKPSQDSEENSCPVGPSVPPQFSSQGSKLHSSMCTTKEGALAADSSEEDDDLIGPMPAKGPVESDVTREFEYRAQRMKEKLTCTDDDGSKRVTRESWMTELPPELKKFGLGPRTFKRRADDKSGDRSIWTDTPADRERKAKEMHEAKKSTSKGDEEIVFSRRDKRLAEQVSSYNDSKRPESLMDMHHKKLKSKATEDKNKPQERRPFDRDQDLQVNRFDEAQKKALIKKSRELNTKFEHSKSNMFL